MNEDDDEPPRTSTSTSTSTKTKTSQSCRTMNTLLSSMILISLGAIGGFGIFHSALHHRYVDRIEKTQISHNQTLAMVQNQHLKAQDERNRCVATDDGRLQEMSELRGRLDAQYKSWYDLTAAQRSIQSKHQESTASVQHLQERFQQEQQVLEDMKAELIEKDRASSWFKQELEQNHKRKIELESELTKLKELTDKETHDMLVWIQQKDDELEIVEKHNDFLFTRMTRLETETQELQLKIQQKDDELETVQKNSQTLHNQKNELEENASRMKYTLDEMQSQIALQDEELLDFRQEEGTLETKLGNLREGMLDLLREKIQDIQDLENRVDVLNQEKADLELRLENWQDGMLGLVKEKMQEIEHLTAELAESHKTANTMMTSIAGAQSDQVGAEEYVKEQLDAIEVQKKKKQSDDDDDEDDEEDDNNNNNEELIQEMMEEIEHLTTELSESREWVKTATLEMEDMKSNAVQSETLLTEKRNEIDDLKLEMEREQDFATEQISKFESELTAARNLVEEKVKEIEGLHSEMAEFVTEINDLKLKSGIGLGIGLAGGDEVEVESNDDDDDDDMRSTSTSTMSESESETMIGHVQQRDGMMCRQLFGKGPYYVKFVIRLPNSDDDDDDDGKNDNTVFFVIEISTRKQLPHSAYTFLSLVESNLYNDGAAFLSTREGGGLQIGSSSSSVADDGTTTTIISLEQKLKPLGFTGESSLSFVESSTSGSPLPCGEYSFGFVHRGPGLNLYLNMDTTNTDETDCFAQVIRGQDNLQEIQSLLLESGEPAEIVSVTHLRVD